MTPHDTLTAYRKLFEAETLLSLATITAKDIAAAYHEVKAVRAMLKAAMNAPQNVDNSGGAPC